MRLCHLIIGAVILIMKHLKIIRVILSVVLAILVTAAIFCRESECSWLGWFQKFQLMPALISFSMGVCAFWLAVSLLVGRVYCSTICPLGTLQDAVAYFGKKLRRSKIGDYWYSRPENRLRYVVLGVIIVCIVAGQMFLPEITDPYMIYEKFIDNLFSPAVAAIAGEWIVPSLFGMALSLVTLVAIVTLSIKNGRTFCNTICPVGSVLSVVSRYSLLQLEIDPDICTNCGKCEMACKASCVNAKAHTIDYSRCVLCLNCGAVCDDNAIRFTTVRKRLSTPLMQQVKGKVPQMTIDAPGGDFNSTIKMKTDNKK